MVIDGRRTNNKGIFIAIKNDRSNVKIVSSKNLKPLLESLFEVMSLHVTSNRGTAVRVSMRISYPFPSVRPAIIESSSDECNDSKIQSHCNNNDRGKTYLSIYQCLYLVCFEIIPWRILHHQLLLRLSEKRGLLRNG